MIASSFDSEKKANKNDFKGKCKIVHMLKKTKCRVDFKEVSILIIYSNSSFNSFPYFLKDFNYKKTCETNN